MTTEETRLLFECEIRTRWTTWKPSPQMVEDFIFALKNYDNRDDVANGIKRYRNSNRSTVPVVNDIVAEINKSVGDRKRTERKEKGEWPGQVFVVVHRNAEREEDGIWHFHTANESQEVTYEFQSRRMESHVHYCQTRFSDRYPAGGHFSGEIHTEESFSKRFREISLGMAGPEVKARRAEVEERLFNGEDPKQVFRSMFKVIEEKAKVPFVRNPRANPLLPDVRPPSSNGSVFTEQGIDEIPPFLAEEPGEVIYDDPPATPEPAPKPKKENPKADWLDADLKF